MQYRYFKWLLKFMSFVAILQTTWLEYRWAATLIKNGMWYGLPVAMFSPVAMVYFFFCVKIADQDNGYNSVYRAVRPDFIKFVTLTAGSAFLTYFHVP
jgi:hypothetical protein